MLAGYVCEGGHGCSQDEWVCARRHSINRCELPFPTARLGDEWRAACRAGLLARRNDVLDLQLSEHWTRSEVRFLELGRSCNAGRGPHRTSDPFSKQTD